MNARNLALLAFLIWTIICWRWYVCGIKGACTGLSAQPPAVSAPVATPDTSYYDSTDYAPPAEKPDMRNIERVQVFELSDRVEIHFPYNSKRKEENDAADAYLSKLAQELKTTNRRVLIEGHADFVADRAFNNRLAQARANNIRSILIAKGVAPKSITIKSYGERKPKATNDTPQGRYENRRVEIRILD